MKKYVIGTVALVLIVSGYVLLNQKNNDSYSSNWVSSNLSDNYDLKVWYPDNLNFYCCNDTENGTSHGVADQEGNRIATVGEKINFCQELDSIDCPNPRESFEQRQYGNWEEIPSQKSSGLGESLIAIRSGSYEQYYFDTLGDNKSFGYYFVEFPNANELSNKFKKDFIKRLELK
jgi:hypothetical protein